MSFMDSIKTCFTKYADFSGRARRSEYWYFTLFNVLVTGALSILHNATGLGLFTVLSSLFSLAVLVPGLAVAWRRLHDIGKGGANYLFILIPIVGVIMLLVWFVREGQYGDNAYGPDPKAGERVEY